MSNGCPKSIAFNFTVHKTEYPQTPKILQQQHNFFDTIYVTCHLAEITGVCVSVYVCGCILTALSMPSVNNMMKKITAHTDDPGNVAMASG